MSLAKKKERDEGMDYKKTAQEILNHVGGSKNIISAAHCATRLRLVIADNKKADKGALENVDGVKGVFEASGQLQIILGTGTVNKVFDQFIEIAGVTASSKAEAKEAAVVLRCGLSLLKRLLHMSGCLVRLALVVHRKL